MKGDAKVLEHLNQALCSELTAINQYFLHARILQDWGFEELGKKEYHASIDEMKHADQIIKRILFLNGIPNVQKLNKVNIGQNVKEILSSDLALEELVMPHLREFIAHAETTRDYVTRDLFKDILKSEEEHLDWLETQLDLMNKLGEQNYLQSQVGNHKED
jgi:bacterioferritin